ncbi:MAG: DHHW family protein [Eubacteriales bacterium]|nr:DHHW family protein [Eubacteriales bacterium]
MKKFFMILSIVILTLIPIIPMQTYARLALIVNPAQNTFTINGDTYILENKSLIQGNTVFVPLREVLTKIGYSVQWDESAYAVVCDGDGKNIIMIVSRDRINVNSKMHNVTHAPFFHNDVLYISTEVLQKSTDLAVEIAEFVPTKFDSGISKTIIGDEMRTQTTRAYGSIFVSGTRAMESIVLTHISDYASLISQASAQLPNCNVYNMIVPTGTEYYGEKVKSIIGDVTSLYDKLDPSVIPINVFEELDKHKDENIYFRTDHHWTQRGAYFAYQKFLEYSHRSLPPLSQFPVEKKTYTGSMANFLAQTPYGAVMRNNPDEIEYFKPIVKTSATVYNDKWLKDKSRGVSVVSASGGYLGYIGGDAPVTVIKSSCYSDKKLLIVKESFGNALATWAVNNYSEIYVIDPRYFNNKKHPNSFKLTDFYELTKFDDVLFINYPGGVSSDDFRNGLLKML